MTLPRAAELPSDLSARQVPTRGQAHLALILLVLAMAGIVTVPMVTWGLVLSLLASTFLCVALLRMAALRWLMLDGECALKPEMQVRRTDDLSLPSYSVLVPLYKEANVVGDIVEALSALDYPSAKLEILLILEAIDIETRRAVAKAILPGHVSVLVVPDVAPRTKPAALNYALKHVSGECLVVFDAEDIPEPRQLRQAAALLRDNPDIECIQARLNVHNASESFLTRQFAIEYTALFDCLLPALGRLGFPVPLGGTSNHFRRQTLIDVGGWDSFNVTEDADLGVRLARFGKRVAVLPSTTWEEAPANFAIWLSQRTRWLKGWMQTYLVHMRWPMQLWRQLGARGFVGFQIFMGGVLLSVLVHPWFYILALLQATADIELFRASGSTVAATLWGISLFNLVAGYVLAVTLGIASVVHRGQRSLAWHGIFMPFYWLLISLAAYRALWQLVTAPYWWEKTSHRPRRSIVRSHLPPSTTNT